MRLTLLILIAALMSARAIAGECLHYDLPVQLEGHVERGEPISRPTAADTIQHSWYFNSNAPICLVPVADNTATTFSRFEIWPPPAQTDLSELVRRPIRIVGTFLPTSIPHFHAQPIFSATLIRVAE